ncbi:hypothetical protein AVEN_117117-1 [Araneus ventricosus]|uniref:Uncharacterized protein n=1 Tax=Araneus ventricosus TaxID=182803 RepID=A0A4Y2K9S5_ARAVE|nr:hypothetical protein AVEN_117117-1 [Araneus ventricosus]
MAAEQEPEELDHPALPKHPGSLNDSRCNSSSTEAGVLMAITRHGSTPPEGGHWLGDPAPRHRYTPRGSEIPLTKWMQKDALNH